MFSIGSGVLAYTKKKIFEISRPNFEADLDTQIHLLEEHFANVQNVTHFEVDEAAEMYDYSRL